jgi:hypothetical protein
MYLKKLFPKFIWCNIEYQKTKRKLKLLITELQQVNHTYNELLNSNDLEKQKNTILEQELKVKFNEKTLRNTISYPFDNLTIIMELGKNLYEETQKLELLKMQFNLDTDTYEEELACLDLKQIQIKNKIIQTENILQSLQTKYPQMLIL